MIPLLLYCLASLDATFIGYRAAAGRNALIYKKDYYRKALFRGFLWGQGAVAVICVAIGSFLLTSSDRGVLVKDLLLAGQRMLIVYIPYALIIFLAFGLRTIRSVDIRSITSVLIFGPFVLIRPVVAVIGVGWGILATQRIETVTIGILVLILMLSLESFVGWWYYK